MKRKKMWIKSDWLFYTLGFVIWMIFLSVVRMVPVQTWARIPDTSATRCSWRSWGARAWRRIRTVVAGKKGQKKREKRKGWRPRLALRHRWGRRRRRLGGPPRAPPTQPFCHPHLPSSPDDPTNILNPKISARE